MQTLQKAYRNLLISLGAIALYVLIVFLFFFPDKSALGNNFSVAIMYMFTRYGALAAGIVVLIVRLVRLMKSNNGLVYVLVGTLNMLIGVLCVVLYSLGEANLPWLNKCLLNLLIGTFIIGDVFFWKIISPPSQVE